MNREACNRCVRQRARTLAAGVALLMLAAQISPVIAHGAGNDQPGMRLAAEIRLPGSTAYGPIVDRAARRVLAFDANHVWSYDADTGALAATAEISVGGLGWALDDSRHVVFFLLSAQPATIVGVDTRTLATVVTQPLQPQMYGRYGGFMWSARDHLLYAVYEDNAINATYPGWERAWVAAIDPYTPPKTGAVLWTELVTGCGQPLESNAAAPLGETADGRYLVTACAVNLGIAAVARIALPPQPATPPQPFASLGTWNGSVDLYPGLVVGSGALGQWIPSEDRMVITAESTGGDGWAAYVFDADSLHFVAAPALFAVASGGNVAYDPPGFGVDPVTGRVVAQSRALSTFGRQSDGTPCVKVVPGSDGLAVDEAGLSGVSVLHFPLPDDGITTISQSARYDATTHGWWFVSQHATSQPCSPYGQQDASYLVLVRDSLPAATSPPVPDPDVATADIPEQAGVTDANAASDASAYGVRYVLGPSGTAGMVSAAPGGTCDIASKVSQDQATSTLPLTVQAPPLPSQYHSFCNTSQRTATFAHVDKVSLDGLEARGDAVTADTDRETARDLESGTNVSRPGSYLDAVTGYANTTASSVVAQAPAVKDPCAAAPPPNPASPPPYEPATCDQQIAPLQPYVSGVALPYVPAACQDSGAGEDSQSSRATLQPNGLPATPPLTYPGSASTYCSIALHKATGHADQSSASVGGPLAAPTYAMVASSDAVASRSPSDGSMATAVSTVRDVSVGGILHIASITATAAVRAHGRPHSNRAAYSCDIQGLSVSLPNGVALPPGVPDAITHASCSDSSVQAVVTALNRLLSGVVHIEFPPAYTADDHPAGGDSALVQRESSRGYLSQVALSELDQTQNSILVNDTAIEKPALVVTYFLDNPNARDRLVASYAGVAASARYGIFALDDGGSGGSDAVGGGGSAPLSGSSPLDVAATEPGAPPLPPATAPTPFASSTRAGWSSVPQAIVDGLRFVLQHPQLIPPLLATWLLFLGPACLLWRRRGLLRATE